MPERHPLRPDNADVIRAHLGLDENNLPLSLSPDERAAATNPGEGAPMADPIVSPTGAPVINPKAVPWLALLIGIASLIAAGTPDILPGTTIDQTVASLIVSLGALVGIVSPGWRK